MQFTQAILYKDSLRFYSESLQRNPQMIYNRQTSDIIPGALIGGTRLHYQTFTTDILHTTSMQRNFENEAKWW